MKIISALVLFVGLPLQTFASTHSCIFRKDLQSIDSSHPTPVLVSYSTKPITISSTEHEQGQTYLLDSRGRDYERITFETGTKENDRSEGPLRFFTARFDIDTEIHDLSIVVSPLAPTAYAQTSYDYRRGNITVLVTAQARCWLVP